MKDILFVNPACYSIKPSIILMGDNDKFNLTSCGESRNIVTTNALQMRNVDVGDYKVSILPEWPLFDRFNLKEYGIDFLINDGAYFASNFLKTLDDYGKLPDKTQFILYGLVDDKLLEAKELLSENGDLSNRVYFLLQTSNGLVNSISRKIEDILLE